MKNPIKRLFVLILILILVISPTQAFAYDAPEHNKLLEQVLFSDLITIKNNPDLTALENASYLTIDQFNFSGSTQMDSLISYGIKNLPTIEEIDYKAGGRDHRSYTHRGWDFQYAGEMSYKWTLRQEILKKTVDNVFEVNEKQNEAFCKLVYYVHILGDHLSDDSYLIQNGLKMAVGGRNDNQSIIHELIELTPDLFPNQNNTHKYTGLISTLQEKDTELSVLVNSEGGINSDEEYDKYKAILNDIQHLISLYYSKMLFNEPFFYDVFYDDNYRSMN